MSKLTATQIEQFETEGFLVVRGLLETDTIIEPILAEYAELVDQQCRLMYEEGRLNSTYDDLPFEERVIRLYSESGKTFVQQFDISLPQSGVTADTPIHLGPAVFQLLTAPALLDAVESLIGPEIISNPVQHVRIKPPQRILESRAGAMVGKTSWHQDQGVVLPEADQTTTLTVWMPLTSATLENGCLTVIPGSHRGDLATHCAANPESPDLHIPAPLLHSNTVVPVPMEPGDVLLMHRRTQHASLENQSDHVRWSFDLRYNPTGQPTGRPNFPDFVVRSAADPTSELHDPEAWAELWLATRDRLAGVTTASYNRWNNMAPVCA